MIYGASDLHQCPYVWRSRKDLKGDSYAALHALAASIIADYAPEGKHLILAGDIFDCRKVEDETLEEFRKFMVTMETAGIPVYFIAGNHDAGNVGIPAVLGAINMHNKLFEIDGRRVYGLSWLPRQQLKDAMLGAPRCDLLVTHATFLHLIGFESASALTLEDIPEQVANVLVGDIHVTNLTTLRGRGAVISPGALHPCTLAQGGAHGYWKLHPGEGYNWEFTAIPTRQIFRYTIEDDEELNVIRDTLEGLSTLELKSIVELKYATSCTEQVENLAERYSEKFVFFLNPCSTGKFLKHDDLREVQDIFENISLVASLPQIVDPVKDAELLAFVEALLTSPDTSQVISDKIVDILEPIIGD